MPRKVVGFWRRKAAAEEERGAEGSASASETSGEGEGENGEAVDEEEEDDDEDKGEPWVQWMRRTAEVTRSCAGQARVSDWLRSRGGGKRGGQATARAALTAGGLQGCWIGSRWEGVRVPGRSVAR